MEEVKSIQVHIQAFGIARDILGVRTTSMAIPQGISVRELKNLLIKSYPGLSDVNGFNLALGDDYGQDEDIIAANETISILPPVSGG